MPRIEDRILDCVLYLYPTTQAARQGHAAGGTGFLVGVPSETKPLMYTYAVTNSHVIREGRSPIVRLNTQLGATEVIDSTPDDWVHHPHGDDLAATAIGPLVPERQRFTCVLTRDFITEEIIARHEIGPGDEAFMVGRFVSHDGRQRNSPNVRFGNISMMHHEKVRHFRGTNQEAFLVEILSLRGYSGSPVFVHIPLGSTRPKDRQAGNIMLTGDKGPWLLGVGFGHLPIYEPVFLKDRQTPAPDGLVAEANSGQMGVIPAWKVLELLNEPYFADPRAQQDRTKSTRAPRRAK